MDLNILAWTLLISIGANLLFFGIAFLTKSDKFTDITYASTFIIINLFALFFNQKNIPLIKILIAFIICLWAMRLGTYLLIRIFKTKKDARFDNIRNHFGKFLGFWIIQAFTVYIVSIPAIMFLSTPIQFIDPNFNFLSFLVLIPLFFLLYETIADIQKYKYYNLSIRPSFIKNGLYKYSRFPNYFGELGFWFSICFIQFVFLFTNSALANINYLYLINLLCPIYLMLTVIYLSGVKIIDTKSIYKYRFDYDFEDYVNTTSMIIPFIGKKNYLSLAQKHQFKKTKHI